MKVIDITRELNDEIKIYEGDPRIRIEKFYTVENNGFAITKMSMGSHSGTHIDAPSHVLKDGKNVIDIPLSTLVGKCAVIKKDNMKVPSNIKRIIIQGTEEKEGKISEKQAKMLVDAGVKVVGTDNLSIGNDVVHNTLLKEGCIILESLNLDGVEPGVYTLCALPLKIACDGAPLRACLIRDLEDE